MDHQEERDEVTTDNRPRHRQVKPRFNESAKKVEPPFRLVRPAPQYSQNTRAIESVQSVHAPSATELAGIRTILGQLEGQINESFLHINGCLDMVETLEGFWKADADKSLEERHASMVERFGQKEADEWLRVDKIMCDVDDNEYEEYHYPQINTVREIEGDFNYIWDNVDFMVENIRWALELLNEPDVLESGEYNIVHDAIVSEMDTWDNLYTTTHHLENSLKRLLCFYDLPPGTSFERFTHHQSPKGPEESLRIANLKLNAGRTAVRSLLEAVGKAGVELRGEITLFLKQFSIAGPTAPEQMTESRDGPREDVPQRDAPGASGPLTQPVFRVLRPFLSVKRRGLRLVH